MVDNIGESITKAKTFCFASGQTVILDEDKIQKIPYLAALVSSGDCFESARNEHGHYKLDSHIEYKHFSFILESLSFHSVRQLFTHLPKQNDVTPIIALLDFLGIGPQPDPALREVDQIFFSTVVFSPLLEDYLHIIKPSVIQNMAVRFAIAMAKEEYDFTDCKVVDQIYWFVMFILSAYKFFGSRLRHHVYKIAEHCFSLFEPLLLKSLKKLIQRTQKDEKKYLITNEDGIDPDEDNLSSLEQLCNISSEKWPRFAMPTSKDRQQLIINRTYTSYYRYWIWGPPKPRQLIEPVYRRVLEIIYERLQSEICQRTLIEIYKDKDLHNFVNEYTYERLFLILTRGLNYKPLPKEISTLWKHELVQKEIRELILEGICVLKPKLEKRRSELMTKIREYDQSQEVFDGDAFNVFHFYLPGRSTFEKLQEEALSYELLLDNLNQGSSVEEEIYQLVLDELYTTAQKQFLYLETTQWDICKLQDELSSGELRTNFLSIKSNMTYPKYQTPVYKPLPKIQRKYSTR
ncbi:unnamed protein product [Rotaria sp. Silwood1]|nr:unnamed protein product [Rotaria sp. Silwood1]CAF1582043.1 unnamed protein product [Rotaria sp. Silwood1]CAF3734754.1 unnamed protein product [Rotaria sp. Silwood1]